MSTRLSIRKRGHSGGHHQAMEIEDRFVHWRSEEVGDLIWGLGAMAAEHVFYGQNTTGVGGDLGIGHRRTPRTMVGRHGMGPAPIDLSDRIADREEREKAEENGHGALREARLPAHAPLRADDGTSDGRAEDGGEAQAGRRPARPGVRVAWNTIRVNKEATDYIADAADRRRRALRRRCRSNCSTRPACVKPEIDVLDETTWPVI